MWNIHGLRRRHHFCSPSHPMLCRPRLAIASRRFGAVFAPRRTTSWLNTPTRCVFQIFEAKFHWKLPSMRLFLSQRVILIIKSICWAKWYLAPPNRPKIMVLYIDTPQLHWLKLYHCFPGLQVSWWKLQGFVGKRVASVNVTSSPKCVWPDWWRRYPIPRISHPSCPRIHELVSNKSP